MRGWLSTKEVTLALGKRCRPVCVGVCEPISVVLGPREVGAEQICGWPGARAGLEAERPHHCLSCWQERGLGWLGLPGKKRTGGER